MFSLQVRYFLWSADMAFIDGRNNHNNNKKTANKCEFLPYLAKI